MCLASMVEICVAGAPNTCRSQSVKNETILFSDSGRNKVLLTHTQNDNTQCRTTHHRHTIKLHARRVVWLAPLARRGAMLTLPHQKLLPTHNTQRPTGTHRENTTATLRRFSTCTISTRPHFAGGFHFYENQSTSRIRCKIANYRVGGIQLHWLEL